MNITNKHDMLALMHRGAFGNHMRTWYSIEDLLADPPEGGRVGIRNLVASASFMLPHLPVADAVRIARVRQAQGARCYFQESPPDEDRTIQGELGHVDGTLTFYYSREPLPMRPALVVGGRHAYGLEARWLLKKELTSDSYADIMGLLETYENHVVEFTAFNRCVGWTKGRNHCVWEVRQY